MFIRALNIFVSANRAFLYDIVLTKTSSTHAKTSSQIANMQYHYTIKCNIEQLYME